MRRLYSNLFDSIHQLTANQNDFCCDALYTACTAKDTRMFYESRLRNYHLLLYYDPSGVQFDFCPWCGTRFSSELTDKYFYVLENEYKIDTDKIDVFSDLDKLPDEFRDDTWWKKRNL